MSEPIKGFKAFDKGLICRGKQYAENTRFTEDVEPRLCSTGIHFCEQPLDVLKYYPIFSEFAEVEALGETDRGDDKTCTNDIQIKNKITIYQLFQAHFERIFKDVEQSENLNQTSGDEAHSQTSGYKAHSQTSGKYAHSQTSGDEAHSQTSGDEAHSQTSGNYAHSQTSGKYAHSQTSGDEAHSQTSGYKAHSQTSGNEAIACALGIEAKAKAVNGWIVIVDWRYDGDKYVINKIHSAKVGQKINKVKIQPDIFYWFENGQLMSEK